MTALFLLGTSHHVAPVSFRERFSIAPEALSDVYHQLLRKKWLDEVLMLSTCNRFEVYAASHNPAISRHLSDFFLDRGNVAASEIAEHGYVRHNCDVIEHLFAVASGLDSMVLGETEILGQLKKAYASAQSHRVLGKNLNILMQKTFNIAKRIRSSTGIHAGHTSIGSVSVHLAAKIFGRIDHSRVLIIGTGEQGRITARALRDRGARELVFLNRTVERAAQLAQEFQGRYGGLDELTDYLTVSDIVICSTSAPKAIVTKECVRDVRRRGFKRPLFFIDLAVPRDVEAGVADVENVFCYDIDDLQSLADKNLQVRLKELNVCRTIVSQHANEFYDRISKQRTAVAGPSLLSSQ